MGQRTLTWMPILGALAGAALAAEAPVPVSPGNPSKLALIEGRCPAFSWAGSEGAKSYELVVYRVGEEGEEAEPVLRQNLPAPAYSWTPSLDLCLERGGQYAWSVRAVAEEVPSEWSPPSLFEVAGPASEIELQEALDHILSRLTRSGGEAPSEVAKPELLRALEEPVAPSAEGAGAPMTLTFSVDGDATVIGNAFVLSCGAGSATTFYRDADDDTFGDAANPVLACVEPQGHVVDSSDCNDSNPLIGSGTCCSDPGECSGQPSQCVSPSTCQGERQDAACPDGVCTVSVVEDDSGCTVGTLANACGLFADIFCSGAEDQTAPVCPVSCSNDLDCDSAAHCYIGACVPDSPNGSSCATPSDCQSGYCVDGLCCESSCEGVCESCALSTREGYCDPIGAGLDPDAECAAESPETCGTTGSCSGARTCALYPSGTVCVAASCEGETSNLADTCDGIGACVDNGQQSCAPYTCVDASGSCRTSCSLDEHCQSPYVCSGGVCTPP